MRTYGNRTCRACEIASSFGKYGADDGFYELFCGSGHKFCAGGRGTIRERLLVADGDHAIVDRVRVRELARLTGQRLRVALADFEIPVCILKGLVIRTSGHGQGRQIGLSSSYLSC